MAQQKYVDSNGVTIIWDNMVEEVNKKAPLSSPNFIGAPTAPTPEYTSNSTRIATTAFVHECLNDSKATYTLVIDTSNSNPLTCCTYKDDAVGMEKGSSSWDNRPIFNGIRPCMFKNGTVQYYLDANDFNKKADGNPADLTGNDGDVMIEINKFAYFIETSGDTITVSITSDPTKVNTDKRYKYYPFTRSKVGDLETMYVGAYKGWLDSAGKLRSLPGKQPANNKNIGEFQATAKLNGTNYDIMGYFQLVALQCLYLIKYGSLNGQTALGAGVTGRNDTVGDPGYGAIVTGGTEKLGMYYGTTGTGSGSDIEAAKLCHVKFAGIEDFWGNIWEWVSGMTTDAKWNILTTCGDQNWTTPSGLTADEAGWNSKVSGTTESGFMNTAHKGSATTYFCDYGHLFAGRVLRFGGRWLDGLRTGPFALNAFNVASYRYVDVGARLAFR